MESAIPVIVSIVAGIMLGVSSNWLYDILKCKELLPDNPSLKAAAIATLFFLPFVFLVAWPTLKDNSFLSSQSNSPPIITQLTTNQRTITAGESATITAHASDQDGDPLSFFWSANRGLVPAGSQGPRIEYVAPMSPGAGIDVIKVTVTDGKEDGTIVEQITVSIEDEN